MDIVTQLPMSTVGMVPHANISLLEVCFTNKEVQHDFLSSLFVCKHFMVQPIPPTGTPSLLICELYSTAMCSQGCLKHSIYIAKLRYKWEYKPYYNEWTREVETCNRKNYILHSSS